MNHSLTVLEISLDAIQHNLDFFRSKIGNETLLLVVLKASGYGSDAIGLGKFLEQKGVDYFAVAYVDEGIALRKAGVKTPILVLHPQIKNLDLMVENSLEPNLYSHRILNEFIQVCQKINLKDYPVHLKFNTGLNRLGFRKAELATIFKVLSADDSLYVKSIFSHLVASEDHGLHDFTLNQIAEFNNISNEFEKLWDYLPVRHMTNTSGILNFPEAHFDMVRLGLGLYGFANDKQYTDELQNVFRLKSIISQLHQVGKNESVGYNLGYKASKKVVSATIPVGHADGIFRALGQNKIFVTVNGQKAPVIGNICMDMIMADVSDIDCQEGDEVIIFDSQKEILDFARQANTISYEVLTALGPRIKRELV